MVVQGQQVRAFEDGDLKLVVPVRLNQMRTHIRNYVNIANVRLRCEK